MYFLGSRVVRSFSQTLYARVSPFTLDDAVAPRRILALAHCGLLVYTVVFCVIGMAQGLYMAALSTGILAN